MAKYKKYAYEELKKFCNDAFEKIGFTADESKIISNLVFERKNIESEYDVDLEKLQNDQEKLQEILDRVRQGD